MAHSTATPHELELRYGMRRIRSIQFGLAVFSTICCIGHTIAIGLLILATLQVFAYSDQEFYLEAASIIVGIFAILLNRPAMYFALELWTAIEAAINQSRERQHRGWIRRFMNLMPLSIFIPPGDLLAVVLLLLRIRANTDHLKFRQIDIFKRCELAFGFGAVVQYIGFAFVIAFVLTAGVANTFIAYAIGFSCHVLMMCGLLSVVWSSKRIRGELLDVVCQTHWEQDPAAMFLAALDVAVSPTNAAPAEKHISLDAEVT